MTFDEMFSGPGGDAAAGYHTASAAFAAATAQLFSSGVVTPADADAALRLLVGHIDRPRDGMVAFETLARAVKGWLGQLGERVDGGRLLTYSPLPVRAELHGPVLAVGELLCGRDARLERYPSNWLLAGAAMALWAMVDRLSQLTGAEPDVVARCLPTFGADAATLPELLVAPLVEFHIALRAELSTLIDAGEELLPVVVGQLRRRRGDVRSGVDGPAVPLLAAVEMDTLDAADVWELWPHATAAVGPDAQVVTVGLGQSPQAPQMVVAQVLIASQVAAIPSTMLALFSYTVGDDGQLDVGPRAPDVALLVTGRRVVFVPVHQQPTADRGHPTILADSLLGAVKQTAAKIAAPAVAELGVQTVR